jgi:hypothetical protein
LIELAESTGATQQVIYILIGYMWLFIHRPFEIWPALENLHIERIYMILTLAAWISSGRIRYLPNPLHLAFAAFTLAVLVCWFASPWFGTERSNTLVENYFKLLVFYVMLVTTVQTERELKLLCLAFLGIMSLYMAHSYREYLAGRHEYRMGIARMVGVDASLGDPNSFAGSILYALPLVLPCWSAVQGTGARWKRLLIGYVGLSGLCIVLTGSRGALVGMIILASIMILRSRMRSRLITLAILLSPLLWSLIPADLQTRFYTMIDPSVGPDNAQASAESRSEGFWIGLRLWQAYPLTGCGPGVWRPATGRLIESHNLYGQVPGEMGALGVLTFGSIVFLLWRNCRAIKSIYRRMGWAKDFFYYLGDGIGMAVLMLLIQGYGAHNLFRFNWLWYGAFLIIARHLVGQRARAGGQPWPRLSSLWALRT